MMSNINLFAKKIFLISLLIVSPSHAADFYQIVRSIEITFYVLILPAKLHERLH